MLHFSCFGCHSTPWFKFFELHQVFRWTMNLGVIRIGSLLTPPNYFSKKKKKMLRKLSNLYYVVKNVSLFSLLAFFTSKIFFLQQASVLTCRERRQLLLFYVSLYSNVLPCTWPVNYNRAKSRLELFPMYFIK